MLLNSDGLCLKSARVDPPVRNSASNTTAVTMMNFRFLARLPPLLLGRGGGIELLSHWPGRTIFCIVVSFLLCCTTTSVSCCRWRGCRAGSWCGCHTRICGWCHGRTGCRNCRCCRWRGIRVGSRSSRRGGWIVVIRVSGTIDVAVIVPVAVVVVIRVAGVKRRADRYSIAIGCHCNRIGLVEQSHAIQPVGTVRGDEALREEVEKRIGGCGIGRAASLCKLHVKLDARRSNRQQMAAIGCRAGCAHTLCRGLIDTDAIGIELVQIGIVVIQHHRVARWDERDRSSLVRSRLQLVEWQRGQHLAGVCKVGSHPWSAAQRAIHRYCQQAVIAAIGLHLGILQSGHIRSSRLGRLPVSSDKVRGDDVIALVHVHYAEVAYRGAGLPIVRRSQRWWLQ